MCVFIRLQDIGVYITLYLCKRVSTVKCIQGSESLQQTQKVAQVVVVIYCYQLLMNIGSLHIISYSVLTLRDVSDITEISQSVCKKGHI